MPRFRAKNNTDLLPFVLPKTTTVGYVSAHFLRSVSTGPAKSFIFFFSFFFPPSFPFLFPLFRLLLSRDDYYTETTITFPRRYPLSWLFAGLRSTVERTQLFREGREREGECHEKLLFVSIRILCQFIYYLVVFELY